MARTPTAATPETEAGKGGRSPLLLVGVAVVVTLAIAAAAFFLLGGSGADASEEEEEPVPVEGAVVDVAEMTLNLAGPTISYAKVSFAAVLLDGVEEATVQGRFALLKDAAISELGTISADSLRTPEGVEELRSRLSARAAAIYPEGEVLRIVLTELVVQ